MIRRRHVWRARLARLFIPQTITTGLESRLPRQACFVEGCDQPATVWVNHHGLSMACSDCAEQSGLTLVGAVR